MLLYNVNVLKKIKEDNGDGTTSLNLKEVGSFKANIIFTPKELRDSEDGLKANREELFLFTLDSEALEYADDTDVIFNINDTYYYIYKRKVDSRPFFFTLRNDYGVKGGV